MLWLYRIIVGFLLVEFSGDCSERILNLCTAAHISLWNLKCKNRTITGCVTINNFRRLREVRGKTKIRIRILKKCGLPFFIRRYRKRLGFVLGAVFFIFMLNFLSGFIWAIDVKGNARVESSEIISACESLGIREGIRKSGIDTYVQREKLLLDVDSLAWASLNIEGSVLTVNVTEIKKKTVENKELPTNLKATADGIVKKIDITAGNAVVKVGDTVAAGDLLVSGIVEKLNSTAFVHSLGTVTAETERTVKATADYVQKIRIKTGDRIKKSVLSFFGFKIPLYIGAERYDYDSMTENYRPALLGRKMPVYIVSRSFDRVTVSEKTYDRDALIEQINRDIEFQIKEMGISEYNVTDEKITEEDGKLTVEKVIKSEENIAFQEILIINSGN